MERPTYRRSSGPLLLVLLTAALAIVRPGTLRASSVQYSVLDLGTLGGNRSEPADIGPLGQVVGSSSLPGNGVTHAFLYDGSAIRDLGTLGGANSQAFAINSGGQVVGSASLLNGASHAFIYQDGMMQDLSILGDSASAVAINAVGQIAGTRQVASNWHAFILSQGQVTDLGTLGGPNSRANAMNDSGELVGFSNVPSGDSRAFRYSGGTMIDISTLVGRTVVTAMDINDAGDIAVWGNGPCGEGCTGLVYTAAGPIDIGNCLPFGLNSLGDVVGRYDVSGSRACLITGGRFVDLNAVIPPGTLLQTAVAINDAGQIAATGLIGTNPRAYLLTPLTATTTTTTSVPAGPSTTTTGQGTTTTSLPPSCGDGLVGAQCEIAQLMAAPLCGAESANPRLASMMRGKLGKVQTLLGGLDGAAKPKRRRRVVHRLNALLGAIEARAAKAVRRDNISQACGQNIGRGIARLRNLVATLGA